MTQAIAAPASVAMDSGGRTADYVVKGGWYTLWTILALTLFGFVDRQVLTLAAAPMAVSLGLSDAELGMVQGLAFAIFTVVAVYPIAWVADRFDRRIVMGLCVLTWTVGTAACGLAQTFPQLFGAAILIAAGEAGLAPIGMACIPELFKGRKRLLANGLMYIFAYAGIAAGLALGGSAIGLLDAMHGDLPAPLRAFESWRLAFFLVALPAPLLLILLAFTALGRTRPVEGPTPNVAASPAGGNDFWPFVAQNRRAIATVFGGLGLYMLAFGGYLVWLPVAATRLFGTTPAENGAAMGIATAVGMIGGVAAGTFFIRRMIVRTGPMATVRFFGRAMLVSTPILIAFPFVGAAWQAFVLFGALMLSGTAIGCVVPTLIQDMAPSALRARMFAIWGIVSGLVAGSAPTLVGWVSTALGTEPRMLVHAISLVAVPCWLGAILCFRIAEKPFADLIHLVAERERESI